MNGEETADTGYDDRSSVREDMMMLLILTKDILNVSSQPENRSYDRSVNAIIIEVENLQDPNGIHVQATSQNWHRLGYDQQTYC